mgnify:CR=1 FL=1
MTPHYCLILFLCCWAVSVETVTASYHGRWQPQPTALVIHTKRQQQQNHWALIVRGGGEIVNADSSTQQKTQDTSTDTSTTQTNLKKQGAYGKITIHKEPKWKQLLHLDEILAALRVVLWTSQKSNMHSNYIQTTFHGKLEDLDFCDVMLTKVSRSFASVIKQLPDTMLVDIMIFYLVLRALDTIEDDTAAFDGDLKFKIMMLKNFHKLALQDPLWTLDGVGDGDEKRLLQEFPKVHRIYNGLSSESQEIIADITKRMGAGMAEFVGKDLSQGTADVQQYNRYCHFVAGLVGEGLSRLFAQSGLEEEFFADEKYLSNQMGLFLQKTNIIRDYLEDYVEGRAFWPQTIWKPYTNNNGTDSTVNSSSDLGYFQNQTDPIVQKHSIQCLNELVTDALDLVPSCLAYLSALQCLEIFRFCAIPQVMAIATLAKCYANEDVFTGVVKIRKGLSCKLILHTNNLDEVKETFYVMAKTIEAKARQLRRSGFIDPSMERTLDACDVICAMTEPAYKRQQRAKLMPIVFVVAVLACQFIPYFNVLLAAAAILNYYFGPFRIHNKDPNMRGADQLIKQTWKEVMGKKRKQ